MVVAQVGREEQTKSKRQDAEQDGGGNRQDIAVAAEAGRLCGWTGGRQA
jgi:hypothetical protein